MKTFKSDSLRLHLTPDQVDQVREWKNESDATESQFLVVGAIGARSPLNWSIVIWRTSQQELNNALIAFEIMSGRLNRRRTNYFLEAITVKIRCNGIVMKSPNKPNRKARTCRVMKIRCAHILIKFFSREQLRDQQLI